MKEKTDRRVKRTRHLLLHALTTLMSEKSIKDITVKELCEAADVNRGTFYLHYKDILDMLEKTEQELLQQFSLVFQNCQPQSCPDFPYPLFLELFEIIDQNSYLCYVLLSPNGDISFLNKIRHLFQQQYTDEDHMEDRTAFQLPNSDYFESFIISGCAGLIESWLAHGKKESPSEMAVLISKLISTGARSLL